MISKKKLLSCILVLAILVICIAASIVSIHAADIDAAGKTTGVLAEVNAADLTLTGFVKEGTGAKIARGTGGNIQGLTVKNVEPGIYKYAIYMSIDEAGTAPEDVVTGMQDWRMRLKAAYEEQQMYYNMPYFDCTWDVFEFQGLANKVGKKIVCVSVFEVLEKSDIVLEVWMDQNTTAQVEGGPLGVTVDKLVLAAEDHNMGPLNFPGYELYLEGTPQDGGTADYKPEEWNESNNKDGTETEPPVTTAPPATETPEATDTPTATVTKTPAKTNTPVKTGTGSNDGDNNSLGLIIGIVAAVVIIAGIVVYFFVIKKKKK